MPTAPHAKQKDPAHAASFAIACIFPMPITKRILHNAAAKKSDVSAFALARSTRRRHEQER
jgi:hypothetical protein